MVDEVMADGNSSVSLVLLSGNFELDYLETCRRMSVKPSILLKFGLPLPPLPTLYDVVTEQNRDEQSDKFIPPVAHERTIIVPSQPNEPRHKESSVSITSNLQKDKMKSSFASLKGKGSITNLNGMKGKGSTTNLNGLKGNFNKGSIGILSKGKGSNGNILKGSQTLVEPRLSKRDVNKEIALKSSAFQITGDPYTSRYTFGPKINVETLDGEDDEDVYKIEMRGNSLSLPTLNVLNVIIPGCPCLSHINFWNCGLNEKHFNIILQMINSAPIRVLSIDQNPDIPQACYSQLLNDDAGLKTLSLRGNNISNEGVKNLSNVLKTNRTVISLNLFDNKIGAEGAIALGETLKVNTVLVSLSLGRNDLGDEGALCNIPLTADEVQLRKKLLENDRSKHDYDEDPKKKSARPTTRAGSAKAKGDDKDDKKKLTPKPPAGAPGKKAETQARPTIKTPEDPKLKKTGPVDKLKKDPKNASIKPKKGKLDDSKDDAEDNMDTNVEPMFDVNGQFYILGNRSLNSLNLCSNNISETGVRHLLDAVNEQELTSGEAPDLQGLFRIVLQYNNFPLELPANSQLNALLNSRNPFFEETEAPGEGQLDIEGANSDSESFIQDE